MQLKDVQNGVFSHTQSKKPNRSRFDLSRVTNFTADSGMIIPFDYFETLPGDSFKISADVALETLPTVTNVLTPYKVKIHWYYLRNSDLWAGWDTFITKGRSGNISLSLPLVKPDLRYCSRRHDSGSYYYYQSAMPHSLSSFLGVPYCFKYSNNFYSPYPLIQDVGSKVRNAPLVSALPFMAYQNIVKYNYVDQNLLQSNVALFPVEGDSDWRLPYNLPSDGVVTCVDGSADVSFKYSAGLSVDLPVLKDPCLYGVEDTKVLLTSLRYAPFDDDYFTSALPWLQRGNVHTMDLSIDGGAIFSLTDDATLNTYFVRNGNQFYPIAPATLDGNSAAAFSGSSYQEEGSQFALYGDRRLFPELLQDNLGLVAQLPAGMALDGSLSVSASMTANQFRELLAYSVWQERNATVNGSYNSMIWVHWNTNPNEHEHKPVYIGGSVSYVQFGETVQTSATPSTGSGTPQGTITGMGRLLDNSDYGRFDSPDYGYVMGIMIISPSTTYNTQIDKNLLKQVMEDYPQPEFESLSPEPIFNKELYFSGNSDVDNDLFGYQERYSYYKTRNNRNCGLFMSLSTDDTMFSSATQAREFKSTPKLSYEFVTQSMANTRRDWLAYMNYPMFKVQVASHIDAVRPLSYAVRPNTFGF